MPSRKTDLTTIIMLSSINNYYQDLLCVFFKVKLSPELFLFSFISCNNHLSYCLLPNKISDFNSYFFSVPLFVFISRK